MVPSVSVCIPARNEAATVARVIKPVVRLGADVIVVDDGSDDATAAVARRAGARVVSRQSRPPGKGAAMAEALEHAEGDIVVFLDADVRNFRPDFVTRLVDPLVRDPGLQLVKATYVRPLDGVPNEGGRVTELLGRPFIQRFFPELAFLRQPLAGEVAVRRRALEGIVLEPGYGVEVGMLIDVAARFGAGAIAQVDLGVRVHRNRPLAALAAQAGEVLDAFVARVPVLIGAPSWPSARDSGTLEGFPFSYGPWERYVI